jgi:hypothetical protein
MNLMERAAFSSQNLIMLLERRKSNDLSSLLHMVKNAGNLAHSTQSAFVMNCKQYKGCRETTLMSGDDMIPAAIDEF